MPEFRFLVQAYVCQPSNFRRLIYPPCILGCFCQIFWPIRLFYAKMSTNGSRAWITGLIILFYIGFSIACCLNLLHTKNTAKGANLLHPLDVEKAKKASASGGLRPPADPPPGALPPGPPLGAPPPDPRYRLALPRSPWHTHFSTPSGAYVIEQCAAE